MLRLPRLVTSLALGIGTLACDGGPARPGDLPVAFTTESLELGPSREGVATLRNVGTLAVGPVLIEPGAVRDAGGSTVPGARILASPNQVPTMNPGDDVDLAITLELSAGLQPGGYHGRLAARVGGVSASLGVGFEVLDPVTLGVAAVEIRSAPGSLRRGDVAALEAVVRDTAGAEVEGLPPAWSVAPADAGWIDATGRFVAYGTGPAWIVARAGAAADSVVVDLTPRGLSGSFVRVGEGRESDRHSSDLWVHGDHAYQGTWAARVGADGVQRFGNTLYTWNVATPFSPRRTDTLEVDARTVNDVKVRADGALAIITHEGSNDGRNGVTLLDLRDPARPSVVARFTEGLESGVHNAWIDGDHAYLVVDGVGNGLRVLDVSNPSRPRVVASWWAGTSFLHDVYVRDGLAFLSHWNAGLVVLDVGNGIAGGSPGNPVEVGRVAELGGQTHNAWYWPEAGYVFVGEEDFETPGRMHVVDVRDLYHPREVATFAVPGQPPHNFWLDEERGVLHMAWYGRGIRSLDVTGELLGDLARQGRQIAELAYGGPGCGQTGTCAWAPQLVDGLLYLSDVNAGLVVLRPEF